MGLFRSIKNFFAKAGAVAGVTLDEKAKQLEKTKIVELASKDVKQLRDKVRSGIEKCAETKVAIKKLENENELAVKRLSKVSEDYDKQIQKIKDLISSGASEEDVKLEKIEANSLLKIKKSISSEIETIEETVQSLNHKQRALLNGLKVMNSNISVMESELAKQKARKHYIELHNDIVKSISGAIGGDEAPYLAKLEEDNTFKENVISLNEEVLGTPTLLSDNTEIDAEVEADLAK